MAPFLKTEGCSGRKFSGTDGKSGREVCLYWDIGPAQTFRLLTGEVFIDLRFLGHDPPKKKNEGKKAHS
jgi:hypothetical protein